MPFWWMGRTSFLTRPWLNADLLVPLVLAARWPFIGLPALVLIWSVDMAVSQSLAFHFHSAFEFIRSIEFMPALSVSGFISPAFVTSVLPFAVCGLLALILVHRQAMVFRSSLWILLVIGIVDILNGSSFLWLRSTRPLVVNVAGSGLKVAATSMSHAEVDHLTPLPAGNSLTSVFDVLAWSRAHPERGILLVLVESMGLHRDAGMQAWLRAELVGEPASVRFQVTDHAIEFRGSTTWAEVRELCGLSGSYREITPALGAQCLPRRLSEMGWQTIGLHGFSHRMFMRSDWWPEVGLQRRFFGEELSVVNHARCGGAFAGACDADLLRRAVLEAGQPKTFVYALTLNSHLPLGPTVVPATLQRLCDRAGTGKVVCELTATLGVALSTLKESLALSAKPPLVLVVGDHMPPLTNLVSRAQYDSGHVPAFVLIPKNSPDPTR